MTGDDSRNNWVLAIVTLGEGWHNNHHHFQSSTRQGFRWWEIDVTFYILKALSWLGLVWDLKSPPAEVVSGERRLRTTVIERVANQLAHTFPIERITEQIRVASGKVPSVGAALSDRQLLHIPSLAELKQRAQKTFVHSPSLDAVAVRARQIIIHAVSVRVFGDLVS